MHLRQHGFRRLYSFTTLQDGFAPLADSFLGGAREMHRVDLLSLLSLDLYLVLASLLKVEEVDASFLRAH